VTVPVVTAPTVPSAPIAPVVTTTAPALTPAVPVASPTAAPPPPATRAESGALAPPLGASRPPTLAAAVRQAAAPFAVPLGVMLLIAAYVVLRGLLDRRDVRLATAPAEDRWVGFR
jgi:hypothetical protein